MLRICLVLLLALSASAYADTMLQFPRGIIEVGDGPGRVMQVAGKPDRIVPLSDPRGGSIGERWEYYINGKTLSATFSAAGKVVDLEDQS